MIIKWGLRSVCSDFSASGHLALLLRARCAVAWCPLLYASVDRKKQKSLLGFYERSNPAEKVCTATLLCHPRRSDPWPLNATNAIFRKAVYVKFPVQHQPLWSQKLIVGRFFVSPPPLFLCLVPSRWRLQPNSQPIPARPLPFEQPGSFIILHGPTLQRQKQTTGCGITQPRVQSIHLKLY